MADLLAQGLQHLAHQLMLHASTQVVYHRGVAQVALQAIIGRTRFRTTDSYGNSYIEWSDRDYLVNPEDLVISGLRITPQHGDKIYELIDGKTYIYEVMAPNGEPVWRYSDPHQTLMRIHAKLVQIVN